MKNFLQILILLFPVLLSGQITITGTVRDSARGSIVPFATVYYAVNDSMLAGTTADINGNFSLKINQTGTYELISNFLYARDAVLAILEKDTIINFLLKKGLEFDQPCRIVNKIKGKHLDFSTDKYDKEDYERIKIETRKLQLTYIPELTDSFYTRIWAEPAFDYYGGYIYEFTNHKNEWQCKKLSYSCNLLQFEDSINIANPEIYNEIDDSTLQSLLSFRIYEKTELKPKNGWSNFEKENFFEKLQKSEPYCNTMLKGDRFSCMDGIRYHIEIKIGKEYMFVTFYNPQCVAGQYKQIDLFLELLEYIEEEFEMNQ